VLVNDPQTGQALGASFLAKSGPGNTVSFTATPAHGTELTELEMLLPADQQVIAAWEVSVLGGYSARKPLYLSFVNVPVLSGAAVTAWEFTGGQWAVLSGPVSVADGYASFEVAGSGTYAVSAVPEAGALALLLAAAFAGVVWQWWRK